MSWRRLGSLLRHLPRESWFVAATVGEKASWSVTDHLLAAVFDALQISNWMFASANSGKGQGPPKPKPMRRPGERAGDRIGGGRSFTIEEMRKIQANWSQLASGESTLREL